MKNFPTCHSHPQSLDSGSTPEAFVKREVELGTGVVTCTDHGTLGACRAVYDLGKKAKLIPVLGLEGYLRDDDCEILKANGYSRNEKGAFTNAPKYMHFCVHFMDQAAYECGVRLLSRADALLESRLEKMEAKDRKHGSERKPLFVWRDMEELGAHNVTMTTGCMIGVVQRHLLDNNDLRTAEAYFDKLKSIVKPGHLYTELNPHDTSKDWIQGIFLTMADGTKLRFYKDKKLMTNVGEVTAEHLARAWGKSDHHTLKSIKDRQTWREMPEQEIKNVENLEGFFQNECKPWAPDGDYQAGLNRVMRALAKKRGIPIIVGDDSHYAHKDEKIVQDVRLTNGTNSWKFYGSYHRQSSEEAFAHFSRTLNTSEAEFEGWVETSHEWAAKFKDFKFDTPVSMPTKFYEAEYAKRDWFDKVPPADHSLRYTLELIRKHGRMDWNNVAMRERLQEEIKLLHNNGTVDLLPYFLVDEEVCSLYESKGLLTGPGRGSAAGLILTYLLGITHVDPLKFGLSLERFITLDRIASGGLPDIDQDLPHRELLDDPEKGWLKERFGNHCAQISVDSTLRLKMAVRDVSRAVRGHVPPDIERIAKKFPQAPQGITEPDFILGYHSDSDGDVPGACTKDENIIEYINAYPDDWEITKKTLGLARQKGRHACAFVIANRPIEEFIPLTTVSDVRVTSYTAPSVEAVGGLKMDFLVVNSLNDIGDCIRLIQEFYYGGITFEDEVLNGKRVPKHRIIPVWGNDGGHGDADYKLHDIWDLPEDQDVFADVATGKTETVFQFNTPGAQKWLEYFKHKKSDGNYAISSIEDMAAFTALDRPGPLDMSVRRHGYTGPIEPPKERPSWNGGEGGTYMDTVKERAGGDAAYRSDGTHNMLVEYAIRARGGERSADIMAVFDDMLPETYGVMVYQEQLQKMYQKLTGCTGPEAEDFRKNVAKKKKEKIDKAYPFFIEKATAQIGEENAKEVWKFFITWAKYGFNKSHAVCYSVIGYACAFLKHHYPLQWWTAVLRNAKKEEVGEKFWRYCGEMIDLPDVKLSGENFEIREGRIRAPVSLLQGVGDTANAQLKKYAPYTDIDDFCKKIYEHQVQTGTWEDKTKTKKERKLNPATGKKESVPVEVPVRVLKKGYNALNRGVVQALILGGAMDSLFPSEMHLGEQLNAFEDSLAAATGTKRKAVDQKLWDVGQLVRYQMRKEVLPVYGQDLVPLVEDQYFTTDPDLNMFYTWTPTNSKSGREVYLRIANAKILERAMTEFQGEGERTQFAVAAYVQEQEVRPYAGGAKAFAKLKLNIDGALFEVCAWPSGESKKPDPIYYYDLKGSVIIAVLNRYGKKAEFSLADIRVVQMPLGFQKEEEKEDAETANAG